MVGSISGFHSYYSMYYYGRSVHSRAAVRGAGTQAAAPAANVNSVEPASRVSAREPVRPVRSIQGGAGEQLRSDMSDAPEGKQAVRPGWAASEAETEARVGLSLGRGIDPAELAVRMRIQYEEPSSVEAASKPAGSEEVAGIESAQEAAEEGKCETCEKRKYQDGSDDMGVSFQTPTHIAPENAAARVRGHEQEHVVREQAKAEREGREVVSQSVTLKTSVCPECGKVYVSGGNTRTTKAAKKETEMPETEPEERRPFVAMA